ncbi:MAG: PilZ domain-containing protein [Sphingomonadales bacterium]|nr:PilZ domain-containing protein [Sphingomonadales bacterium]MDE2170211.1 PilZ domain-containing protein [Sphingomonadales bacterium]
MVGGAQLSVTELRRSARHPVSYRVIGEHRTLGDLPMHIVNISAHGFMAHGELPLSRGERVVIRLPRVGRIEAHLIWSTDDRAGFQFERIIRLDDFGAMIDAIQPPVRGRRANNEQL